MATDTGRARSIVASTPPFSERFEIIKTLGEGAAGAVFLVRDRERENGERALKLLANASAFDEHTLKRFKTELEILKQVRHPNIAYAYDLIETPQAVAFTLEYVEGQNLGQYLAGKKVDPSQVDLIFSQILSAVHELHQHGVVHRDMKLENVLLGTNGVVKVTDLGLMKELQGQGLTKTGILLGTAQYLPPEYVKNGDFDERGDIYAVGLMLYECLSGKRWLTGKDTKEIFDYLFARNFEFPAELLTSLPHRYRQIVQKAVAADPGARYFSADSMRRAILSLPDEQVQSVGVEIRQKINLATLSEQRAELRQNRYRSRISFWGLLGAGFVGAVCTMGVASFFSFREEPAASVAPSVAGIPHGKYSGTVSVPGSKPASVLLEKGATSSSFKSTLKGCEKASLSESGALECSKQTLHFEVDSIGDKVIKGRVRNPESPVAYAIELTRE